MAAPPLPPVPVEPPPPQAGGSEASATAATAPSKFFMTRRIARASGGCRAISGAARGTDAKGGRSAPLQRWILREAAAEADVEELEVLVHVVEREAARRARLGLRV